MDWLQSIIYGFICGFSEFIPVSASAQGQLLQTLFDASGNDAVRDLLVHIFSLAAFLIAWRNPLEVLRQTAYISHRRAGGYRHQSRENPDSRFVHACTIPMLLAMILCYYFTGKASLTTTAFVLFLNGIILYLPERMLHGNKTARAMSAMDALFVGAATALSVVPGFSRIGMSLSISQMLGADRKHGLNWAYMLCVPALLLMIGADLASLVFGGQGLVMTTGFFGYLLIAVFSFAGSYLSVYLMKNIVLHRGLSAFAYYSWGSALFALILYLL